MFKKLFAGLLVILTMVACTGSSKPPSPPPVVQTPPTPTTWPGIFRQLKSAPLPALAKGSAYSAASTTGAITMSCARTYHTATQIPDGRIVILGGATTGNAPALTIDIFDPLAERFITAATTLPVARFEHQAVLMDDGRIALIGGGGTDYIDIYDPVHDVLLQQVMLFEHERRGFKVIEAGNGKILAFGGYDNNMAMRPPVLIDTLTWTQKVLSTDPKLLRSYFGFTKLKNGKVVISGGNMGADLGSAVPTKDVILFDPTTETFQTIGTLQENRIGHSTLELPNGTLGVYGGAWQKSTETFDFTANTSVYGGDLISSKSYMLSACLQNGFTLHCGGKTGNLITNTQMVYDPASKASGYTNNMLTSRKDFTLTVMPNGCYLVTGGQDDLGNILNGAEVFDPQASVTVTYPAAVLPYTESVQLTASGNTTGLVWTCDVGSVDQSGKFTAPGLSSTAEVAYITATNANGKSAVVHVAFTRDIILVVGPTTVVKDSTANNYKATINWYAADQMVTWSTDKGKIDAFGVLDATGLAVGDVVMIKATLNINPVYSSTLSVLVQ